MIPLILGTYSSVDIYLSKCNDVKLDIVGKLPNDMIYHIVWIPFVAHVLIWKFMS